MPGYGTKVSEFEAEIPTQARFCWNQRKEHYHYANQQLPEVKLQEGGLEIVTDKVLSQQSRWQSESILYLKKNHWGGIRGIRVGFQFLSSSS